METKKIKKPKGQDADELTKINRSSNGSEEHRHVRFRKTVGLDVVDTKF